MIDKNIKLFKNMSKPAMEMDEEVYETQNANDDFDRINEEKLTYTKFASSAYSQQSAHIDQDPIIAKNSMKIFNLEST